MHVSRRVADDTCWFQLSIAMIHGEEKMAESERDDGRNSPPPPDVVTRNAISLGLELLPGKVGAGVSVRDHARNGVTAW